MRDARALIHVGIANPRWHGKRSRHLRRMRNQQLYVSGKRPVDDVPVDNKTASFQKEAMRTQVALWFYEVKFV